MSRTIIALEIQFKDTSTSPFTTGTKYMADEGFVTLVGDTLASQAFDGRVSGSLNYSVQLSTAFWGGAPSISIGAVMLRNEDGFLDDWLDLDFRDQSVTIKKHTSGASYNSATTLVASVIEKFEVTGEKAIRLVIRDPAAALYQPLTQDVYTSASPQTTPDSIGILKPIAFGAPKSAAPVLIDEANRKYEISDTALLNITQVLDQGVSVDYVPISNGFRLLADPSGKIVCDPITSGTGSNPLLTESEDDYTVLGAGRSIKMFDSAASPETSLRYGFSDIAVSKNASDGGKFYFEASIVDLFEPSSAHSTFWVNSADGENGVLAVGVAKAAISNPQHYSDADLAVFVLDNHHQTFLKRGTIAEIFGTTEDTDIRNGASFVGSVIGVKLDLDALTIDFLLDNATPPGHINGPYSISTSPLATFFPVLGASSDDGRHYENTIDIRVVEADFTYSIPAGYSAWQDPGPTANTGFDELTQSISDRVSVTFNAATVATIEALSHSSPAVKYSYGYSLLESTLPSTILNWAMSSIGGAWFVNRSSEVQFLQLAEPGSSVATIDDTQISGDIRVETDYAPGLSNRMGSDRNWSPYREAEVSGTATEVFKQQISRQYRSEYKSTNVLATAYGHADGNDLPFSLLIDATAAQVEADRFTALYATEKKFWTVPVAFNSVDLDTVLDDIGNTYTIDSDRFGLDGGVDLLLIGVDVDFLGNEVQLRLWGTKPNPPPMMTFNGVDTWYESNSVTVAGNVFTVVGQFKAPDQTTTQDILRIRNSGGSTEHRVVVYVSPNNHATEDRRNRLEVSVNDNAAAAVCRLVSDVDVNDGKIHTFFFSWNYATAAFVFKVDGQDADDIGNDARIAPVTGTAATGAAFDVSVGSNKGTGNFNNGQVGFLGYGEVTATWSDFFHANGAPKAIDETSWTQWTSQPEFWNRFGTMSSNKGSAGNMTANGNITGPE